MHSRFKGEAVEFGKELSELLVLLTKGKKVILGITGAVLVSESSFKNL